MKNMLTVSTAAVTGIDINVFLQIIAIAIPLVGFVVSYFLIKRQFKNDLIIRKQDVLIGKMTEIMFEVLTLYDEIIHSTISLEEATQKQRNIMKTIFSYGSLKAIQIAADIQQSSYQNEVKNNPQKYMIRLFLLVCIIKEDVTGIEVSPEYWFKIKINDYSEHEALYKNVLSELLKKYELGSKYRKS